MFLQYGWYSLPLGCFLQSPTLLYRCILCPAVYSKLSFFWGNILYLLLRNFGGGDNLLSYKQKAGITPSLSYLIFTFSAHYYSAGSSLQVTSAWQEKESRREYKHRSPSIALRLSSYSLRYLSYFSSCKNFLEANSYPSSIPTT